MPESLRKIDLKAAMHPTAIVHPHAKLGAGVKIGAYAIIGEHVTIGDGCDIGPRVLIEGRTTLGKNNTVLHSATLGGPPQDLKYEGQISYLEVGDNNTFREFVTVNVATNQGARTVVGSDCYLMAYAHVAHDCTLGDHVLVANSVNLGGYVTIDDYAIIGGQTPIHQFCRIGQHAFVGGTSRVDRDIPPFFKAEGIPTRIYGVNTIGLERRGFSSERRAMIKKMFVELYRRNRNVSQALEQLKNGNFKDPERQIMVDFLERCERGISK